MPEKPPTIPPEEDFAFVRNLHEEDFGLKWTPETIKRIHGLFEEVGWAEAYENPKREKRLHDAYHVAIQDSAERIGGVAARAGRDEERVKKGWEAIFRDQMDLAVVALAHGNPPSIEGAKPVEIGPVLLRMKEILGGKA